MRSLVIGLLLLCLFLNWHFADGIPLTEEAWNNWQSLTLPEQLLYILDDGELQQLKEEHALLGSATLPDMLAAHADFQDPETTEAFFHACDSDSSGGVTFQEYCICRGDHDRFGVVNDIAEYSTRADYLLDDFEAGLQRRRQHLLDAELEREIENEQREWRESGGEENALEAEEEVAEVVRETGDL